MGLRSCTHKWNTGRLIFCENVVLILPIPSQVGPLLLKVSVALLPWNWINDEKKDNNRIWNLSIIKWRYNFKLYQMIIAELEKWFKRLTQRDYEISNTELNKFWIQFLQNVLSSARRLSVGVCDKSTRQKIRKLREIFDIS